MPGRDSADVWVPEAAPELAHALTEGQRGLWLLVALAHVLVIAWAWSGREVVRDERAPMVLDMELQAPALAIEPEAVAAPKARPNPKRVPAQAMAAKPPLHEPDALNTPESDQAVAAAHADGAVAAVHAGTPQSSQVRTPAAELAPTDAAAVSDASPHSAATEATSPQTKPLKYQAPVQGERQLRVYYGDLADGNQVGEGRVAVQYDSHGHYRLVLQAKTIGLASWLFPGQMNILSRGVLGPSGFMPERYTYAAGKRGERATNFDRANHRLTFSASTDTFALPPDVQDRLSVVFQLGLIAQDNPAALAPGQSLTVPMAGIATLAPMLFHAKAHENLVLAHGAEPVLYVATERAGERDQARIEVWLARQRQYVPVRVRYTESNGRQLDILILAEGMAPAPVVAPTPRY